jgi:hypothetical protein
MNFKFIEPKTLSEILPEKLSDANKTELLKELESRNLNTNDDDSKYPTLVEQIEKRRTNLENKNIKTTSHEVLIQRLNICRRCSEWHEDEKTNRAMCLACKCPATKLIKAQSVCPKNPPMWMPC